jgi:hypothetical protein
MKLRFLTEEQGYSLMVATIWEQMAYTFLGAFSKRIVFLYLQMPQRTKKGTGSMFQKS